MTDIAYDIIIVIIFILIIIALFLWVTAIQEVPPSPAAIQFAPASYGMRCVTLGTGTGESNVGKYTSSNPLDYTPQVCDVGLVCVKINENDSTGFCKKAEGQSCTSVYECEPNLKLCSKGVCAATITGGINQEPPCLSNLIEENGVCKVPLGGKCNITNDCYNSSLYQCVTNDFSNPNSKTCNIPYENGAKCLANSDCETNNCDTSNAAANNGLGTCQPSGDMSGDLGATCLYYQAKDQDTACQNNLGCNLVDFNLNNGVCLPLIYSWPNNSFLPECTSNSCIAPSICINSTCVFPTSDPLSCQLGVSSGYCLNNYTCLDNECLPNSGYPGIGDNWRLIQWIRSKNNEMGYWNPLEYLEEPGTRPSLTSFDHNAGTDIIYARDVSIHTSTSYNYIRITNQTQNNLALVFIKPSDWNFYGINPLTTPYNIHYTTTTTNMYISLLVSIEAIGFGTIPVILRYILIGTINNNTATFTLPTADTFIGDFDIPNTMPTEIPKNFAIDLREVTRVGVVFDNVSYEGSNNNSLDPIFLSAGTASLIFTVFTPVGVKDINFYYFYIFKFTSRNLKINT